MDMMAIIIKQLRDVFSLIPIKNNYGIVELLGTLGINLSIEIESKLLGLMVAESVQVRIV